MILSDKISINYSWSQTTKRLAQTLVSELVVKHVAADMAELTVAADTFPNDMYATSDVAKRNQLPQLTSTLPSLSNYQTILVGGPIWGGQVATPVRTLLKELQQFKGTVAPFYTDASAAGNYEVDFQHLLPDVSVVTGLEVSGQLLSQVSKLQTDIEAWYAKVGLS